MAAARGAVALIIAEVPPAARLAVLLLTKGGLRRAARRLRRGVRLRRRRDEGERVAQAYGSLATSAEELDAAFEAGHKARQIAARGR